MQAGHGCGQHPAFSAPSISRRDKDDASLGRKRAARTLSLVNVFAQDEITLHPGVVAIVGSKFEHNSYTGFEYQPTARLRWHVARSQMIWGGVSRAVRMPSRFDTDLRFTAGTPFVVIQGNPGFQSENVIETELGYRNLAIPHVTLGVTVFNGRYDNLRSQEPTPLLGFPIVLGNLHSGHVRGVEIATHVEPRPWWQLFGGYTLLDESFEFDPASRDTTGGSLEHNDPRHQFWFRSSSDLPRRVSFDLTLRRVGALPKPVVPAHTELTLRVARPVTRSLLLELIGDNLLHARTLELVQLGPPHAVPRSAFVRLTWETR